MRISFTTKDSTWATLSNEEIDFLEYYSVSEDETTGVYSVTIGVLEDDNSYRYRALMQKPQITLKFSLPFYVEIPVGAQCEYQGETYYLNTPQNIKKNGTRLLEYTLTLGGLEDNMSLYKLRNTVDRRLKWSMCATPKEFIEEIVKNLNERDGDDVWSVGECIDANPKTVEFNHTNIDSALQSVADTFETEWEINDYVISLHKVEYYKDAPLSLSYGKGNGFVPGLGRSAASDDKPIKRLYVQGGERNIDRANYKDSNGNLADSAALLLPKSQTLEYEGRQYTSDADGYYIERSDTVSDAVKEDSLDCSETYPSRIGTVSSVEVINESKNFYDIIDNSIPDALNYSDCLIEGETMTIIFQTGMLAGSDKEFEVTYKHSERRFEIVPQEIDGVTMPNETFKPVAGDTYAIFGCMLPQSYICDNDSQTGASWEMFKEAAKYLYENEDQKFTFSGTLQALWAKRNWVNVGGKLKVGSYIHFTDEQFAADGVDIRIVGIKDFLTSPYSPTIEISNSVSGSSLSSQLQEIARQEVIISEQKKALIQFTKRRFKDAQETMTMLEESLLNYSNSINPIAVQTMGLLVGDESLQFKFVKAVTDSEGNVTYEDDTDFAITYDNENKQLSASGSILQHLTLGIDSIKPSHDASEYKRWTMTAYVSAALDDASAKYYFYAKCSKTDETGEFLLSTSAIEMEGVSGYYHFLVGILNSEYEDERSFAELYGFTEVLPGRITTDRIVSTDGLNFLDLAKNALHIGNNSTYIDWNNLAEAVLSLKNVTIETVNSGGTVMYRFSGEDGSGNLAMGNITWDTNGNLVVSGTINASAGKIGGFRISSSGITNMGEDGSFDDDAYIIFRNDNYGTFAGIGGNMLPATAGGLRAVARFENHNEGENAYIKSVFANYAIVASAKNSYKNCAIAMNGGYIEGFALKVQSVKATATLTRGNNVILCLNSSEISITLPKMSTYDDGYFIMIKNLNGSNVKIFPNQSEHFKTDSSYSTTTETCSSYIFYDRGSIARYGKDEYDNLESAGDATMYVYCRDIQITKDDVTYRGAWVQWKCPRDW